MVAGLLIVVGGTAIGQYKEAPWHAEQVARGELPPVEERLPNEPFVYVNGGDMRMVEVGRYTDAWSTGDSPDQANIQGPTDYTLPLTRENNPYGLLGLESSDDFTVWTFYFREGMKFSDGSPFTVHDVLFWWNDLQLNDLYMEAVGAAAPHQGIMPGSVVEAIDDYTMRVTLARAVPELPPDPDRRPRRAPLPGAEQGVSQPVPPRLHRRGDPGGPRCGVAVRELAGVAGLGTGRDDQRQSGRASACAVRRAYAAARGSHRVHRQSVLVGGRRG